jgi:hypothetical protein
MRHNYLWFLEQLQAYWQLRDYEVRQLYSMAPNGIYFKKYIFFKLHFAQYAAERATLQIN